MTIDSDHIACVEIEARLREELAAANRSIESWQREYQSACAREDEQRKRADIMAQVIQPAWMLLQRLVEAPSIGDDIACLRELDGIIRDAAPILAKLKELG